MLTNVQAKVQVGYQAGLLFRLVNAFRPFGVLPVGLQVVRWSHNLYLRKRDEGQKG